MSRPVATDGDFCGDKCSYGHLAAGQGSRIAAKGPERADMSVSNANAETRGLDSNDSLAEFHV